MWSKIQYWIVKRWLLDSVVSIIKKDNGYTNIQIHHPKYGIIAVHPTEEQGEIDSEVGFNPFLGYMGAKKTDG